MENASLARADYVVVAGFFVVMLVIGAYFAGRMKSLKDFFSAGGQVPWWVSGLSLYMSTFSAFTFVVYSSLAYREGLVALVIWWSAVPSIILTTHYLAPRWRRAAATSPLEFIETRYGPALRQGFGWLGVPLIVVDDALKLFVIAGMVAVSLGLEQPWALPVVILVCGTIILVYTFLGGLWAVMVTDCVQFFVMFAVVVVLYFLAGARIGGGWTALYHSAPGGFWSPTSDAFTWPWILAFAVVLLLSYATRWSYVQRYYSVPSDTDARKVGYLMAFLTAFTMPVLFFPAMAASIFMPGIEDGNTVYPLLCAELLPVGMMGMVVAAMFSATMSMLSSDYNAVASVITNDIVRRLFARDASERALVLMGRLATACAGAVAMGIAVLLAADPGTKDLVDIMAKLFSVLLPPVAIPMVFGLLTRRASNAGGVAGFLAGTVCGIAAYALSFIGGFAYLNTVQYLTWITALPTLAVLGIISVLLPDGPAVQERVSGFLDGLEAPAESARKRRWDRSAAVGVQAIGLAVAAMGLMLVLAVTLTRVFAAGKLSLAVGVAMAVSGALLVVWARRRATAEPANESGSDQ